MYDEDDEDEEFWQYQRQLYLHETCSSVANKTAMIYGQVTFRNVLALLNNQEQPTKSPDGISVERFAAMVTQTANRTKVRHGH